MSIPNQYEPPPSGKSGSRILVIVLVVLGVLLLVCGGLCAGCLVVVRQAGQAVQKELEKSLKQMEEERHAMRRAFSDASAKAIAAAEQHPEVVERVGKPLEPVEMHTLARPDELNSDGEAFSWDVKGPKGKGVLRAIAVREEGVWRPTQIRFTFEDDSSVDISSPDAK